MLTFSQKSTYFLYPSLENLTTHITIIFNLDLVTDMAFSSDARWIVTSSLDKTVKVWHVPTGNLIDHIGFSSKYLK